MHSDQVKDNKRLWDEFAINLTNWQFETTCKFHRQIKYYCAITPTSDKVSLNQNQPI